MNKNAQITLAGIVICGAIAIAVTSNFANAGDAHDNFEAVTVTQLDELLASKKSVAVDANGSSTREKYGIIPGAITLTSTRDYSLDQLPKDKDTGLVFYCANERCMSAPFAAERAKAAGYKSVKVLRAGIMGWKDAGKKTIAPPKKKS